MNAQHNAHSRGGGFEVSLSLLMTESGLRITDDKERENSLARILVLHCHALRARIDGVAHGDALFANLGQFQNSTAHFKFVIASKFAEFAWQSIRTTQSRKRTAENGNFASQNCGLSRCARNDGVSRIDTKACNDGVAHGDAFCEIWGNFKTLPAMLVELCDE